MPIFVERFLLAICAALFGALMFTNPWGMNVQQRIFAGAIVFLAALLISRLQHVANQKPALPKVEGASAKPDKVDTNSAQPKRFVPIANPRGRTDHNLCILREYYQLPSTSGRCLGRENVFEKLDAAWNSSTLNVCTLVASGGVGKTSLVKKWIERLKARGDHGACRIFSYSFYHQGALQGSEIQEGQSSANEFLSTALGWFGDSDPDAGSSINKAERLTELVQAHPTLLFLDGLEPLQHQVDDFRGKIRDNGIQRLLILLARANPGLCVVTTRVSVADLREFRIAHKEICLENLSIEAGELLLRELGVKGRAEQIQRAVEDFDGHALTLTLLGNYLRTAFQGEIQCRDRLGFLTEEREDGDHARRVMESYRALLSGKPEASLLNILGLFDRPASMGAIRAVVAGPRASAKALVRQFTIGFGGLPGVSRLASIGGWLALSLQLLARNAQLRHKRNKAIAQMLGPLWNRPGKELEAALATLRELGLVNPLEKSQTDGRIDCHPLIRQHFGEALREKNRAGWEAAHSRLFDYYSAQPKDELPATIEAMSPLYAAVAHGCRAGRYVEAGLVYYRRMLRGSVYSVNHHGAVSSDLALMTYFFEKTWDRPAAALSRNHQAMVLHWTGTLLATVGRYAEGVKALEQAKSSDSGAKAWAAAATSSRYLGFLRTTFGDLEGARREAMESVQHADRTNNAHWQVGSRSTLGYCLHQLGMLHEAGRQFVAAETALRKVAPDIESLHSVWGYWYCELLLDLGHIDEAKRRGEQALLWAPKQRTLAMGELLDTAVAELIIARVSLSLERRNPSAGFPESKEYLRRAIESIRTVDHQWLMPPALLAQAECFSLNNELKAAADDLADTLAIADGSGLKLYEVDYRIGSAELCLQQGNLDAAGEHLAIAGKRANDISYHRRDVQILLLYARRDKIAGKIDDALRQLSAAARKAKETGCQEWLVDLVRGEMEV